MNIKPATETLARHKERATITKIPRSSSSKDTTDKEKQRSGFRIFEGCFYENQFLIPTCARALTKLIFRYKDRTFRNVAVLLLVSRLRFVRRMFTRNSRWISARRWIVIFSNRTRWSNQMERTVIFRARVFADSAEIRSSQSIYLM